MNAAKSSVYDPELLETLGLDAVAYVKSVTADEIRDQIPDAEDLAPGMKLFVLHAADGQPILVTDTLDGALGEARKQKLDTVKLN